MYTVHRSLLRLPASNVSNNLSSLRILTVYTSTKTMMGKPLPNQGRPPPSVRLPPPDISHIFRDPKGNLDAYIVVVKASRVNATAHDHHWLLCWLVAQDASGPVYHELQAVHEATTGLPHLTFWGPRTGYLGGVTRQSLHIPLAKLTPAQRAALDKLSWEIPVMEPDGHWNSRSWLRALLDKAVREGVLARDVCDAALHKANHAYDVIPYVFSLTVQKPEQFASIYLIQTLFIRSKVGRRLG